MSYRIERLNSEMRRALSQIISKLKDPRISEIVTVTNVSVAKDLKTAKASLEIYGDEEKARETFEAVRHSAGFIRKEVAKAFHDLRTVPEFTFVMDNSLKYSEQIDKILEEIKKNNDDN